MSKPWTLDDLPPHMRAQAVAQITGARPALPRPLEFNLPLDLRSLKQPQGAALADTARK